MLKSSVETEYFISPQSWRYFPAEQRVIDGRDNIYPVKSRKREIASISQGLQCPLVPHTLEVSYMKGGRI